jgi:hypothetical protein
MAGTKLSSTRCDPRCSFPPQEVSEKMLILRVAAHRLYSSCVRPAFSDKSGCTWDVEHVGYLLSFKARIQIAVSHKKDHGQVRSRMCCPGRAACCRRCPTWCVSLHSKRCEQITHNMDDAACRYLFMNSKTLFVSLRKDYQLFARVQPAMVHVNYHSDKFTRIKAILAAYQGHDSTALMALPDASG